MNKISKIVAREILDSRGNPTIEVDMWRGKLMGRASVPSGASTGSKEALEMRDGDKNRYLGKGVLSAVKLINERIAPKIISGSFSDQVEFDQMLLAEDGSENKKNLGANSILALSLAFARLNAEQKEMPLYQFLRTEIIRKGKYQFIDQGEDYFLPLAMMNIINGGAHASNNLDFQEFMIIPNLKKSFKENLRAGAEIFHQLKKVLNDKGLSTGVGDEGGFAPNFRSHEEGFECILTAIEKAHYKIGQDVFLSLDVAASEFYDEEKKIYTFENKKVTGQELITYYEGLTKKYPIYSIEDGLHESDYSHWQMMTKKLGQQIKIVGDDLFVTNPKILKEGIAAKWANSILIKLNQIGTLTETLQTINLARENNYSCIISHRSGETCESFIADLAVATNAKNIKTGSLCRMDRVEKYNQLIRIEENLAGKSLLATI